MGFSRQEYWSGLSFPSQGDLPNPGIKPASPALAGDSLPLSYLGSLQERVRRWLFMNLWTVVLEKTLESSLDCKEIKPVNPKGNQPWIFTGRTDAEAEVPRLWAPDAKSRLIRKDPDAGKDEREEEKGTTEDEMVGRHHRLNGHEFEQATGDSEGQGSLECCSPWHYKESDTTEWLNRTNNTPRMKGRGMYTWGGHLGEQSPHPQWEVNSPSLLTKKIKTYPSVI